MNASPPLLRSWWGEQKETYPQTAQPLFSQGFSATQREGVLLRPVMESQWISELPFSPTVPIMHLSLFLLVTAWYLRQKLGAVYIYLWIGLFSSVWEEAESPRLGRLICKPSVVGKLLRDRLFTQKPETGSHLATTLAMCSVRAARICSGVVSSWLHFLSAWS